MPAAAHGTSYSSGLAISGGDDTYSNPRVTAGTAPTGLGTSIVSGKLRLSGHRPRWIPATASPPPTR